MRLAWGLAPLLSARSSTRRRGRDLSVATSTTPGATQQYIIYNTTSGTGVTWSVNGMAGGNATVGTITTGGLYTAPASVPTQNVVTVKATSTPSGIFGSSAVTIQQPTPMLWSTYPSSFPTGSNQTMSLNGGKFPADRPP